MIRHPMKSEDRNMPPRVRRSLEKGELMKTKNLILMVSFLVMIGVSGCSCRAWYEGIREKDRRDCYNLDNPIERQECLERVDSMPYDKYVKEREGDLPH